MDYILVALIIGAIIFFIYKANKSISVSENKQNYNEKVKTIVIDPEIKDKIWSIVSPTNVGLPDHTKITALGEAAVPAVIHYLKNPMSEYGAANQAILAWALEVFAESGNKDAAKTLRQIVDGKIKLYDTAALEIAKHYIEENNKTNEISQKDTKEMSSDQIKNKLHIGMTLQEIIELLGSPTAGLGGDKVMSKIKNIGADVSGSTSSYKKMTGKQFMEWERPEGRYKLVIENAKLTRIYSAPDADIAVPKELGSKCEKCGMPVEENELQEVGIQDGPSGKIRDLKICMDCFIKLGNMAGGVRFEK